MAHLHFCSRFWCPMEDGDNYEIFNAHSEVFVGGGEIK